MPKYIRALIAIIIIASTPANADTTQKTVQEQAGYLMTLGRFPQAEALLFRQFLKKPSIAIGRNLAFVYYLQGQKTQGDRLINALIKASHKNPKLQNELKAIKTRYAYWKPNLVYAYQAIRTQNPTNTTGKRENQTHWGMLHSLNMTMRMPHRSLMTTRYRLTDYEQIFADRHYALIKLETNLFGYLRPAPFIELEANHSKTETSTKLENYDSTKRTIGFLQRIRTQWGGLDTQIGTSIIDVNYIDAEQSHDRSGNQNWIETRFFPNDISQNISHSYTLYAHQFDLNQPTRKNNVLGATLAWQVSYGKIAGSFTLRHAHRSYDRAAYDGVLHEEITQSATLEACRSVQRFTRICATYGVETINSTDNTKDSEKPIFGVFVRGISF